MIPTEKRDTSRSYSLVDVNTLPPFSYTEVSLDLLGTSSRRRAACLLHASLAFVIDFSRPGSCSSNRQPTNETLVTSCSSRVRYFGISPPVPRLSIPDQRYASDVRVSIARLIIAAACQVTQRTSFSFGEKKERREKKERKKRKRKERGI